MLAVETSLPSTWQSWVLSHTGASSGNVRIGRTLCCKTTGEPRSHEYLLQRISIVVQRGNAAAVLGTMGKPQLDSWE